MYKLKSHALNRRGRGPLPGFIWPQCQVYDESRVNCACTPTVVAACATAAAAGFSAIITALHSTFVQSLFVHYFTCLPKAVSTRKREEKKSF